LLVTAVVSNTTDWGLFWAPAVHTSRSAVVGRQFCRPHSDDWSSYRHSYDWWVTVARYLRHN